MPRAGLANCPGVRLPLVEIRLSFSRALPPRPTLRRRQCEPRLCGGGLGRARDVDYTRTNHRHFVLSAAWPVGASPRDVRARLVAGQLGWRHGLGGSTKKALGTDARHGELHRANRRTCRDSYFCFPTRSKDREVREAIAPGQIGDRSVQEIDHFQPCGGAGQVGGRGRGAGHKRAIAVLTHRRRHDVGGGVGAHSSGVELRGTRGGSGGRLFDRGNGSAHPQ
mmetsp:Transcript_18161/g.59412  ORF Transcript_18161/g.59412 Transcript_18161/m.59412 type:complete len:223 (-) Transcript_18161:352-1020(-)